MRNLVPISPKELAGLFKGLHITPSYRLNSVQAVVLSQGDTQLEIALGRDHTLELSVVEEGVFEDRYILESRDVRFTFKDRGEAVKMGEHLLELGHITDKYNVRVQRVKVSK